MNYRKGDIVLARATVWCDYRHEVGEEKEPYLTPTKRSWGNDIGERCMYRSLLSKLRKGLIVGYTFRGIGYLIEGSQEPGYSYDRYLKETDKIKVWLVEPLDNRERERWLEPLVCLEEDLILTHENYDEVDYTKCPRCGGELEFDLEYMQRKYGEAVGCIPDEEKVLWCDTCGEAGTYNDLVGVGLNEGY